MEHNASTGAVPVRVVNTASSYGRVRSRALEVFTTVPLVERRVTTLVTSDVNGQLVWTPPVSSLTDRMVIQLDEGVRYGDVLLNVCRRNAVGSIMSICQGFAQAIGFESALSASSSTIYADLSDLEADDIRMIADRVRLGYLDANSLTTLAVHISHKNVAAMGDILLGAPRLKTLIISVSESNFSPQDARQLVCLTAYKVPGRCHLRIVGDRVDPTLQHSWLTLAVGAHDMYMRNVFRSVFATTKFNHSGYQDELVFRKTESDDSIVLGPFCPAKSNDILHWQPFDASFVSMELVGHMPERFETNYGAAPPKATAMQITYRGTDADFFGLAMHRLIGSIDRETHFGYLCIRTSVSALNSGPEPYRRCIAYISDALWRVRNFVWHVDVVFGVPSFDRLLDFDTLCETIYADPRSQASKSSDEGAEPLPFLRLSPQSSLAAGSSKRQRSQTAASVDTVPQVILSDYPAIQVLRVASFDGSLHVGGPRQYNVTPTPRVASNIDRRPAAKAIDLNFIDNETMLRGT